MDGDSLGSSPDLRKLVPLYIACYILWFGFIALGLWLVLEWRDTLLALTLYARLTPWAPRAVMNWGVYLMGAMWLVSIFWVEAYFRHGVEGGHFWQRVLRVLGIVAILYALAFGTQWIIS